MSDESRNRLIGRDGRWEALDLWTHFHGYQVTWPRPSLHAAEEHVMSASTVTFRNNRKTAGSGAETAREDMKPWNKKTKGAATLETVTRQPDKTADRET
jgi:hypothetical protein